jgi:hypothetical protein
MLPKYEDLRLLSTPPRLHPNGFIQLDLTTNLSVRLHVWPDEELRAQKTRHSIHDHSFDMTSEILTGCLTNLTYKFQPSEYNKQTTLYRAKRLPDTQETILAPATMKINTGYLTILKADIFRPGDKYSLSKFILHDSIPHGLTATIMTKSRLSDYSPLIAIPKGIEPDNEYRRDTIDLEILWSFIQRALEKAAHEKDQVHVAY